MVELNRIYTRGGDAGKTSLGSGDRVAKHDLRVAAYGTVDETNAALGLARLHTGDDPLTNDMIARIQNDLFDLGADLCTPEGDARAAQKSEGALRIVPEQIDRLEQEIDALNKNLAPLASFILPGGTAAAAHLHVARTIVRRSERLMTELATRQQVNPNALKYINRLSDHLFVLGRHLNGGGRADVLWKPGQNRD
jgi:cob(I)alamin adenosyltransferase